MSTSLKSLKAYNSFGVEAFAENILPFNSVAMAFDILKQTENELFVLGGGSNVLFTKNIESTIALNKIEGIEIVEETNFNIILKVGAGMLWHSFVSYCLQHDYFGVENLALIPGTVGAAPIQNIGAYGVEVKNVIYKVECINRLKHELFVLYNGECKFGYRDSVFKNDLKDKAIITYVYFMLSKKPQVNNSYASLQTYFAEHNIQQPNPQQIFDAVVAVRSSKLPDPKQLGNAGSFFKNPEVAMELYHTLKMSHENLVAYTTNNNTMKLAAGWLIEQCGFKGHRQGDAGCYSKQALVLVNYGNATGQEIYNLSTKIIDAVQQKFKVQLEREVNVF